MQTTPGFYDDFLTPHNEQRQLLQLGFADRLLGRLIARLKREGIYDDTLIVVTADHGFAWKVGVETRRSVSLSNVEELGSDAVHRQARRVSARASERRARAHARRDADDRRRAERPLGYRADGRSVFCPRSRRAPGGSSSATSARW